MITLKVCILLLIATYVFAAETKIHHTHTDKTDHSHTKDSKDEHHSHAKDSKDEHHSHTKVEHHDTKVDSSHKKDAHHDKKDQHQHHDTKTHSSDKTDHAHKSESHPIVTKHIKLEDGKTSCIEYENVDFKHFDLNFWNAYKTHYHKVYSSSSEEASRLENFKKQLNDVIKHNKKAIEAAKDHAAHKKDSSEDNTFTLAINEFSDRTDEEITKTLLGGKPGQLPKEESEVKRRKRDDPPESLDLKSWLGPPKKQTCANCYAFGTVAALEAQFFKTNGSHLVFSEQEVSDCSKDYGSGGCDNGGVYDAYRFIQANGGLHLATDYPQTAYRHDDEGNVCDLTKPNKVEFAVGNHEFKLMMTDADMIAKLNEFGPIVVGIQVTSNGGFRSYDSGIFTDRHCSNNAKDINHFPLLVGYGKSDFWRTPFWIIRNSWGSAWGETGYMRIKRGICSVGKQVEWITIQ